MSRTKASEKRRKGSFSAQVLGLGLEQPGDIDDLGIEDYGQALVTMIRLELHGIGYSSDQIDKFVESRYIPTEEEVQTQIDTADIFTEPLSPEAYRRCTGVLIELFDLYEWVADISLSESPPDSEVNAETFYNLGLYHGLISNLVGLEKNAEIAVRTKAAAAGAIGQPKSAAAKQKRKQKDFQKCVEAYRSLATVRGKIRRTDIARHSGLSEVRVKRVAPMREIRAAALRKQ